MKSIGVLPLMKKRLILSASCVALACTAMAGVAFAHGTEKHDKGMLEDAQMKKLHAMMPMFSLALAQMEAALEQGNKEVVDAEGGKIVSAIPDLKKSKPHKNIKQRKKFVELASELESAVKSTIDQARNDNVSGAKVALKKVEAICAACHARFRD